MSKRYLITPHSLNRVAGQTVRSIAVHFKDIICPQPIEKPLFNRAIYLYFENCDDNTIYTWTNPTIFPHLKCIYSNRPTVDYQMLCKLPPTVEFHLPDVPFVRHSPNIRGFANLQLVHPNKMRHIMTGLVPVTE